MIGRMLDMKIVGPSPDHITLQHAAGLAGCNAKTLRRAVQAGHLPRHYLMSRHGPQLVFQRREVEQWMAQRRPARPTTRRPPEHSLGSGDVWSEVPDLLARLQARLGESHAMIAQLSARIEEQDRLIDRAQATITALGISLRQHNVANAPTAPAGGDADTPRGATDDSPGMPRASAAGTRPA